MIFSRGCLGLPSTLQKVGLARRDSLEWLATCGLEVSGNSDVGSVPHGIRKIIKVARACAAWPSLLLPGEAAAGINDIERASFKVPARGLRDAGLTSV